MLALWLRVPDAGYENTLRIFGFDISRAKDLRPAQSYGGYVGYGSVGESFAGAWQRGIGKVSRENILAFSAVDACIGLIAGDISKLRIRLTEKIGDVWQEVNSPSFSPVLRKPNPYQTRIQFLSYWIVCKLIYGNAYIAKSRDNRGVVTELYPLDPRLVTPKIADDGNVWYELKQDYISGITIDETIPASEIIHDRGKCLYHPLIGVSPIAACSLSATQGIRIQQNAQEFFENRSSPGGQLTAPGTINDITAERLKSTFEEKFGAGRGLGRLFVGGDGLKFEPITMPASDAQLIEQLRWTVEDVARCFRVPLHKLGAQGNITYNNVGQLNQDYYSQTLQEPIESIELLLDEGLALPSQYGTELDLDGLLRMDPLARAQRLESLKNYLEVNEGRASEGYGPTEGGNAVYRQQQEFSLAALAKRDALPNPFVIDRPTANPTPSVSGPPAVADPTKTPAPADDSAKRLTDALIKRLNAAASQPLTMHG
jgi:HK97 family phage portal protein